MSPYNPLIDWVSGSISFWPPFLLQNSASVPPVEILVNSPFSPVEIPLQLTLSEMFLSNPKQPHIAIINVPALLQALHLTCLTTFFLQFCPTVQAKSIASSKKIDLSSILEKNHEYTNVFSKSKAETLAKWLSHYLYFFSFTLDLLHRKECGKVSCHMYHIVTVTWQEVTVSYHMMSHDGSYDEYEKVVHRPCSSCISSVENLTETLLSSCQMLIKEQLALFWLRS